MANKYSLLTQWLSSRAEDWVSCPFAELEAILGMRLPPSARRWRPWWANTNGGSQASSWLNAGWKVEGVDIGEEIVTFNRQYSSVLQVESPAALGELLSSLQAMSDTLGKELEDLEALRARTST